MKKTLRLFQVLAISTLIFSASSKSVAQVKIGYNPAVVDNNAALQIQNNPAGPYKGLLCPSMTTAQRNSISNPSIGLYVFNTITNCFEYWDGAMWRNLCGDLPIGTSVGVLGGSPGSCAPIVVNGTYKAGTALTASNNAQVQVNISIPGTFNITTNTVNGVSFAASGNFGSTGIQYIVLQGTGTPSTAGTFTYTVSYPTPTNGTTTCSFDVTFAANGTVISAVSCGGALSGSYSAGVAMNGTNTKVVTVTVGTAGSYVISSNVQNNVAFSATGTFPGTGANNVTLVASGTPTVGGTFTYTVTALNQTCTFQVTFTAAAVPTCAGKIYSPSFPAPLTNGNAYTGTVAIPYTGSNGTSYGAETITLSGITLSRSAGTFAAGPNGSGTITYSYSGTYTGASNAYLAFNVNIGGSTCEVGMGDAIRAALSTSAGAYDAAVVDSWVPVTIAEYNNVLNTVGGSNRRLQNNAIMATSNAAASSLGTSATFAETPIAPDQWSQVPASNYIVAAELRNANGGTYSTNGLKIKTSTSQNSGFVDCGNAFPPYGGTLLADQLYAFVRKRPSTTTAAGSPSFVGFYAPSIIIGAVNGMSTTYYSFNGDAGVGNNLTGPSSPTSTTTQMQLISTGTRAW